VDDDADGDRLGEDRLGELEPTAALREPRRRAVAQHRQEVPRSLVAKIVRTAALADAEIDRLLGIGDAVDERKLRWLFFAKRFDVLAQAVDVSAAVGAQLPLEPPSAKGQ